MANVLNRRTFDFKYVNNLLSLKKKKKVWISEKKGFQSNFTHLIRFDHSSKNDLKILK